MVLIGAKIKYFSFECKSPAPLYRISSNCFELFWRQNMGTRLHYVRFGVLIAAIIKSIISWDVARCSLVCRY
jgi:hypothetical protein